MLSQAAGQSPFEYLFIAWTGGGGVKESDGGGGGFRRRLALPGLAGLARLGVNGSAQS